jgi:murein DD-endopeptidase MepM/ murein hydrolase activator NlpD
VNLQWHPASGKRAVAALELTPLRQRFLAGATCAAALLLAVLPAAFSIVLLRWQRQDAQSEATALNLRRREAFELATSGLRQSAARLASGRDLVARIAFLYDRNAVARRAVAMSADSAAPANLLEETESELELLSHSTVELEGVEKADPSAAAQTPSVPPLAESSFVPASNFGWGVSKLTGESEFFVGVDLAAAAGRPVFAAADGVVRWAGAYPLRASFAYSRLGRFVAVRHGSRAVTIYGHLASVSVSRNQFVRRGDLLGTVGLNPWLNVPRLHYEVWKVIAGEPVPIDPQIAMLGSRTGNIPEILKKAMARGYARNLPTLPGDLR